MNCIPRSFLLLLLLCLSCAAQSPGADLTKKIERQVRAYFKIPPDANLLVGTLSPSVDFPNYESVVVTVDDGGKKQPLKFLVSKDHSSMKRLIDFDLNSDPFAEIMSRMDLTGRPARGSRDPKVIVVNFDDFQCPFCARLHQTLFPEILKEYSDRVAFIYKDYPLVEIHPWATHAAVDANCLASQNVDAYWDFADYIHSNQPEVNNEKTPAARFQAVDRITLTLGQKHGVDAAKLQSCIAAQDDRAVLASRKQGEAIGVEGTPALFVNGERIPGGGSVSADVIRAALDRALKDSTMPGQAVASGAPTSK